MVKTALLATCAAAALAVVLEFAELMVEESELLEVTCCDGSESGEDSACEGDEDPVRVRSQFIIAVVVVGVVFAVMVVEDVGEDNSTAT